MNLRIILCSFVLCFSLSSVIYSPQSLAAKPYLFGVFPYLTPLRMDDIYAPLSVELSSRLDRAVRFRTSSGMSRFRARLRDEYYDLAIIQPVLYPLAVDKLGYIPLLRIEEKVYSVIMVPENSSIKSVADLKGKKIGIPPVRGPVFALAKRSLAEHGLSPDTDVSFEENKTIATCFQKLLVSHTDACVAPDFSVEPFERTMGVKFRTLLRSEAVPNQALVIHPRVALSERSRIMEIFLSLEDTPQGQAILKSLNSKGFVAIDDSEYDSLRSFVRDMNN